MTEPVEAAGVAPVPGVTPLWPDEPVFTAYLAGAICRPGRTSESLRSGSPLFQAVGRVVVHRPLTLKLGRRRSAVAELVIPKLDSWRVSFPGAAVMQVARCTGRHMHAPPGQSASFGGAALC